MIAGRKDDSQAALAVVLSVLALVGLIALAILRDSTQRVSGDEGTYLAMAESLAEDFDVAFSDADEERLLSSTEPGRKTVILQRTWRGISYSKPLLPALVMAPFSLFSRELGPIGLNLVLLGAAFFLLWLYLRRLGTAGAAGLTLVTFAATGALLPYALWKTSDVLQAALALAGLLLCLGASRARADGRDSDLLERWWAPWVGAVLLGLLVTVRPPNLLIAGIVPLALAFNGKWRQCARLTAAMVLTFSIATGASWVIFGTLMPYKAERATFNAATGYPAGPDVEQVVSQFERGRATSSLGPVPDLKPRVSAYSAVYFFVGRHTGVLVYFPAALFIFLAALRRFDRTGLAVMVGVAATVAFFVLWLPFNYFGGGSCVGNRYFLASYAALPLALQRPLSRWSVTATWMVALVVGGSALVSERLVAGSDSTSQSHAHAGVFRLLPYESTAADLEGSRDHLFSKDFLRTVDPFARAFPWRFGLSGDQSPAEFVFANLERDEPLRLLVHSSARAFDLVYRDFGKTERVALSRPMGLRGLVEIQPTAPRRYHPLWFRNPWDHGKPYWVRLFRLAVRGADGQPVEAEVRFLGTAEFPPSIFERTVIEATVPRVASAGTASRVRVRVRNDNETAWRSDRLFPVYLSYRLDAVGDHIGRTTEGDRTILNGVVGPAKVLDAGLDIAWPQEIGRYRLRIDLVAEGIAWFERRAGEPLADVIVQVKSADESTDLDRAGD